MKKMIFALFMTYSFNAIGQESAHTIGNNVTIEIPSSAKKVTKPEARSLIEKKFRNDKVLLDQVEHRDIENMFLVDDVLITFKQVDGTFGSDKLEKTKKALDDFLGANIPKGTSTNFSSTIKDHNGNKVLVCNSVVDDIERYYLFILKTTNTQLLTGVFEFSPSDHVKATNLLEKILRSTKFKSE